MDEIIFGGEFWSVCRTYIDRLIVDSKWRYAFEEVVIQPNRISREFLQVSDFFQVEFKRYQNSKRRTQYAVKFNLQSFKPT